MTRHVIEVETFIKGTPEAVYTMLTDHPNLDSFRELSDSVLLREGDTTPHGKGAERQVVINMFGWLPIRFTEDIILADTPHEFQYLVSRANIMLGRLPVWAGLKHYGGEVKLVPTDSGCQAHWKSTIEIQIPLLGNWIGGLMKREGDRIFLSVLRQVGERLE